MQWRNTAQSHDKSYMWQQIVLLLLFLLKHLFARLDHPPLGFEVVLNGELWLIIIVLWITKLRIYNFSSPSFRVHMWFLCFFSSSSFRVLMWLFFSFFLSLKLFIQNYWNLCRITGDFYLCHKYRNNRYLYFLCPNRPNKGENYIHSLHFNAPDIQLVWKWGEVSAIMFSVWQYLVFQLTDTSVIET